MTGYFDRAEREVRQISPTLTVDAYLEAVASIEEPVVRDVLLNTGDREFPDDLRERILGKIATCAVKGPGGLPTREKTREAILSFRDSELLTELHSAFHTLASRRVKCRWGHWSDSPSQNLLSRKCHDEPEPDNSEPGNPVL